MNKENCALKLVDEIILYYDARSKKHQITVPVGFRGFLPSYIEMSCKALWRTLKLEAAYSPEALIPIRRHIPEAEIL